MKYSKAILGAAVFLLTNTCEIQSSDQQQDTRIPIESKDKINLEKEIKNCEGQLNILRSLKNQVFPANKKLSTDENNKKIGFEKTYFAYQEFLTKRKIDLRMIKSKTPPKPDDSPDVLFRGRTSFDIEVDGYKNACMKNARELEAFLYWAWGKEPKEGFKKAYGIDNPDRTFALYLR